MSSDSQTNTPPAPDPSGVPQTPDPAIFAEPQTFERAASSGARQPAQQAEPQSIQFSLDGGNRRE